MNESVVESSLDVANSENVGVALSNGVSRWSVIDDFLLLLYYFSLLGLGLNTSKHTTLQISST